jgi:hypothetical protein
MKRTSRRNYAIVVVLLAIWSGLVLIAAAMPWATAGQSPMSAALTATKAEWTGDELAPFVRAAGLVGLAGVAGIVATRGRARIAIGIIMMLIGLLGAWASIEAVTTLGQVAGVTSEPTANGWPWVAALGCGVLVALGVVTAALGRQWPGLGSRYQRSRPRSESSPWEALDHGVDPTS